MTNPLVMWNSCGLYTSLPYGYNYQRVGTLAERMGQVGRYGAGAGEMGEDGPTLLENIRFSV